MELSPFNLTAHSTYVRAIEEGYSVKRRPGCRYLLVLAISTASIHCEGKLLRELDCC